MLKKVLVVNAGSSSLKWAFFSFEDLTLLASGLAERIGLEEGILVTKIGSRVIKTSQELKNHQSVVDILLDLWKTEGIIESLKEILSVGFRVVHGSSFFSKAVQITEDVLEKISLASKFAPLHNPPAVAAIQAFQRSTPQAVLTASFDTAFHTTIPKKNALYALPYTITAKHNIRKYGFHGLSHRYITERLSKFLNKKEVTFVNMHLGNGASVCAVKNSLSFDTSMGLTPLEGLIMGTRSGNIDPAIYSFLEQAEGLSIQEIETLLNKKSGLLGISGVSSDLRDITTQALNGHSQSQLAIDMFAQRCANYVAEYANKLGGSVDGIVFTAGIGENSAEMRQAICDLLFFQKVELDPELNSQPFSEEFPDLRKISTPNSEVAVFVIRTNEELVIARESKMLFEEKSA